MSTRHLYKTKENKKTVLLIKERDFGVRKTGSVFLFSSLRRKSIYLFVKISDGEMDDGGRLATQILHFITGNDYGFLFIPFCIGFHVE